MSYPRPRSSLAAAGITAALSLLAAACALHQHGRDAGRQSPRRDAGAGPPARARPGRRPEVRINQVGYPAGGPRSPSRC